MQGLILFPATLNKLPLVVIPGVSIGAYCCHAYIKLTNQSGELDLSSYLSGEFLLPEDCKASWYEGPQSRNWASTEIRDQLKGSAINTKKKKEFTLISPLGIKSLLKHIDQLEQRQLKRIREQFITTSQLQIPQDLKLKKAVAARSFIKDLQKSLCNP